MGCLSSTPSEEKLALARNASINSQIKKDRAAMNREIKFLLLGAGESGKTTVLRQMKLIYDGSYTRKERLAFREVIFLNVVQSIKVIVDAMEMLGIDFATSQANETAQFVQDLDDDDVDSNLNLEISIAVKKLWGDSGVQRCFARSREYQLNDSASYYFDAIDRIGEHDYIPTDQDILRSRIKTAGIVETTFELKDTFGPSIYRMVDVGGQRSERKKWIHCFENVTAILFLVALSEYDQQLHEDETVNRMQESLVLFDSICNSQWFSRTSIILFLNKIDLFEEKLAKSPLNKYFKDYHGPNNSFDSSVAFFRKKFCDLNRNSSKRIYVHLTCACDTEGVKKIMAAVNDTILTSNLRRTGMIK